MFHERSLKPQQRFTKLNKEAIRKSPCHFHSATKKPHKFELINAKRSFFIPFRQKLYCLKKFKAFQEMRNAYSLRLFRLQTSCRLPTSRKNFGNYEIFAQFINSCCVVSFMGAIQKEGFSFSFLKLLVRLSTITSQKSLIVKKLFISYFINFSDHPWSKD